MVLGSFHLRHSKNGLLITYMGKKGVKGIDKPPQASDNPPQT